MEQQPGEDVLLHLERLAKDISTLCSLYRSHPLQLPPSSHKPTSTTSTRPEILAMVNPTPNETVMLNVSGTTFHLSRRLLCSVPGSLLAQLFDPSHELATNDRGVVFIDRDPAAFSLLVSLLRYPHPRYLPNNMWDETLLLKEAEFWGVQSLLPAAFLRAYAQDSQDSLPQNKKKDVENTPEKENVKGEKPGSEALVAAEEVPAHVVKTEISSSQHGKKDEKDGKRQQQSEIPGQEEGISLPNFPKSAPPARAAVTRDYTKITKSKAMVGGSFDVFSSPTGIGFTEKLVLVSDYGSGTLCAYDRSKIEEQIWAVKFGKFKPRGMGVSYGGTCFVSLDDHTVRVIDCTADFKKGAMIDDPSIYSVQLPGSFKSPADIAVDDIHGKIYVADYGNRRVREFDLLKTEGGSILKPSHDWPVDGVPHGLAVLPDGKLAVSLFDMHCVAIFDPTSKFDEISRFGEYGEGEGHMNCPMGVAIDGQGLLLVADGHNDRVQIFTQGGVHKAFLGTNGVMGSPTAVAVDFQSAGGEVYVAECSYGSGTVSVW